MATPKQKMALDNMIEDGRNKGKALEKAGYSKAIQTHPKKVLESVGFLQLCEDRGLTDELLVDSLVEDIKTKVGNRRAELELGFKVKGRTKEADPSVGDITVNVLNYYESDHQ